MLHDLTSVLNTEEVQNESKCKIELDFPRAGGHCEILVRGEKASFVHNEEVKETL